MRKLQHLDVDEEMCCKLLQKDGFVGATLAGVLDLEKRWDGLRVEVK